MADKFAGIRLGKHTIEHSRDSRPRVGLSASLVRGETIGDRADDPGFALLDGLPGQLLRKGVVPGEAYLSVRGPSFEWCVPVNADNVQHARAFAEKINASGALD